MTRPPEYFKVFALLRFRPLGDAAVCAQVVETIKSCVPDYLRQGGDFVLPISVGFHYNELSRLDDEPTHLEFEVVMTRILQCVVWQAFIRYFPQFDPDVSGLLFENFAVSSELLDPVDCVARQIEFGYDEIVVDGVEVTCTPLTASVNDFLIGTVARYAIDAHLGKLSPLTLIWRPTL